MGYIDTSAEWSGPAEVAKRNKTCREWAPFAAVGCPLHSGAQSGFIYSVTLTAVSPPPLATPRTHPPRAAHFTSRPRVCPSAVSHSYLTRVPTRSAVLASPTARESSSLTDHRRLARRIGGDFPSNERSPKDLNDRHARTSRDARHAARHVRLARRVEVRHQHRDPPRLPQPHHQGASEPPVDHPTARPLADLIMQLQNARPVAPPTPTDRLTHTVTPTDRSIPIKAATASSSSSSSAPTTSSPNRTNARTTTPPARWRSPWRRNCSKPSAAEHSAIPGGNARRWRRSH